MDPSKAHLAQHAECPCVSTCTHAFLPFLFLLSCPSVASSVYCTCIECGVCREVGMCEYIFITGNFHCAFVCNVSSHEADYLIITVCVFVCVYVCACVHACVCVYACAWVCVCNCVCVWCMCVCVCGMCVCVRAPMCVYARMHVHMCQCKCMCMHAQLCMSAIK